MYAKESELVLNGGNIKCQNKARGFDDVVKGEAGGGKY